MQTALNKDCVNCHGIGIDPVSRKTCEHCGGSGKLLVDYESGPMPSQENGDVIKFAPRDVLDYS
jgi:DnaJ-class molecular chaperone